jgi:hypothetical protein
MDRLSHPTKEMNRKSLRVLIVGGGVAGRGWRFFSRELASNPRFTKRMNIAEAVSANIALT